MRSFGGLTICTCVRYNQIKKIGHFYTSYNKMYFSLSFYKLVQESIDYIWDISHLHLQIYEYFKMLSSM
jgi:hypothetical protein